MQRGAGFEVQTKPRKRIRATADKCYVFPDGTQVFWSATVDRVVIKPKKAHGIQVTHSSFGGVVFCHSVERDGFGNPLLEP